MSRSAQAILAGIQPLVGSVPNEDGDAVCPLCLGPVPGTYPRCYSCNQLFYVNGTPERLRRMVVPMSTALNPSAWYSRFPGYKNLEPAYSYDLASLALRWVTTHDQKIIGLLAGAWDAATIVPSTREGDPDKQPLLRTLKMLIAWQSKVHRTLTYVGQGDDRIRRSEYRPELFNPCDGAEIEGKRILLVEDLWVSGSKCISAAGRLLECGAASVVVLPFAREYRDKEEWAPPAYKGAATVPYDLNHWPRI